MSQIRVTSRQNIVCTLISSNRAAKCCGLKISATSQFSKLHIR